MGRGHRAAGFLVVGGLLAAIGLFSIGKIAVDGKGSTAALDRRILELSRRNSPNLDLAQAETVARKALERAPLDSTAGAVIALAHDHRGQTAQAKALMLATAKVSRRNDMVDTWLFDHLMADKAYAQGLTQIDAFLRRHPELSEQLAPLIVAFLSDQAAIDALADRLAKDSIWRGYVVASAINRSREPTAVYLLFEAMTRAGSKPTQSELSAYLARLVAAKRFEEAYLAWFLALPEAQRAKYTNIHDPAFDDLERTPPFAWNFSDNVVGRIDSTTQFGRPGGALHFEFTTPNDKALVRQLLALTPGTYRFAGDMRTGNPETHPFIGWVILCADNDQVLMSDKMVDTGQAWKAFSGTVQIPEEGCKAQWLIFSTVPAAYPVSVDAWFDNLSLTAVTTPDP